MVFENCARVEVNANGTGRATGHVEGHGGTTDWNGSWKDLLMFLLANNRGIIMPGRPLDSTRTRATLFRTRIEI